MESLVYQAAVKHKYFGIFFHSRLFMLFEAYFMGWKKRNKMYN